MNEVTSIIAHRLERYTQATAAHVWPPPSPPRWLLLITKAAGIIAIVVVIALATDTIVSSKIAHDVPMNSVRADRNVTHVIVDGLHVTVPNDLGHTAIKELIPLP